MFVNLEYGEHIITTKLDIIPKENDIIVIDNIKYIVVNISHSVKIETYNVIDTFHSKTTHNRVDESITCYLERYEE